MARFSFHYIRTSFLKEQSVLNFNIRYCETLPGAMFFEQPRALILPYSLESSFADENIVKPHAGFPLVPVTYWLVNRQL